MQFAYQFPERCERVVVVATGGVGSDLHPLLRLAADPRVGPRPAAPHRPPVCRVGWALEWALRRLHTDVGRDAGRPVADIPGAERAQLRAGHSCARCEPP
jgi:pimeloyl-ACP methyl ester carboxylesterase